MTTGWIFYVSLCEKMYKPINQTVGYPIIILDELVKSPLLLHILEVFRLVLD